MSATTRNANKVNRSAGRDIARVLIGAALLLMLPVLGMQFSADINWGAGDFAIAGVLLVGMGLMYVVVARNVSNPEQRLMVGVGLALLLLLVWVELAVGVFSTPFSGS